MFYCESSKISKKIFFPDSLWTTPSGNIMYTIVYYLNPIKFRACSSYFCAFKFRAVKQFIYSRTNNLFFRVDASYDWKCSARLCVKCAKIRAFSDPYFAVYGQNPIRIFSFLDWIGEISFLKVWQWFEEDWEVF